jgi:hypothetical protein
LKHKKIIFSVIEKLITDKHREERFVYDCFIRKKNKRSYFLYAQVHKITSM